MRVRDLPSVDAEALAGRSCLVEEPVALGDPDPKVRVATFTALREATRYAVRLTWSLADCSAAVNDTAHFHLVPPADGADDASRRLAARWRDRYRYGAFYLRKGPSFVIVQDSRRPEAIERLVITDGHEALLALYDSGRVSAETEEVADALVQNGLAVRAENSITVLPYRIHRWPVPYLAI